MDKIFNNIRSIIALVVVLCAFAFLFLLVTKTMPEGNKDILQLSAGLVLAALSGVIGYYFGSSKNESDKAKTDAAKTEVQETITTKQGV